MVCKLKKLEVIAHPIPGELEWISIMITNWRMPDLIDHLDWVNDMEL